MLTKARAEPGRRKSRDRGKAPAVARRWEAAGCRAGGDDVPPAHPVLGSVGSTSELLGLGQSQHAGLSPDKP